MEFDQRHTDPAIDACERVEALHYAETAQEATIDIGGQKVSVHDFLVTAWTYPEKLRYQIIRERHDTGVDLPYVREAAYCTCAYVISGGGVCLI
ncbi:hypothetical protein [Agrobacterium pusense]|uniref:hypothetical protein n=1 Tax=Agrobacterium pusense TaxID=648995 RepID=UPI00245364B1|nr:hypothetical protein [Agrobacterium pusense]